MTPTETLIALLSIFNQTPGCETAAQIVKTMLTTEQLRQEQAERYKVTPEPFDNYWTPNTQKAACKEDRDLIQLETFKTPDQVKDYMQEMKRLQTGAVNTETLD